MASITAAIVLAENGYVSDSSAVTVKAVDVLAENNYLIDGSSTQITAQNLLDENNYTATDISLINLERLVDNAVDYLRTVTNRSLNYMQGTAGSKVLTCTRSEASATKVAAIMLLKAYKDRGHTSIGGLSVAGVISDPIYANYAKQLDAAVLRLQTLSNENVESIIDTSIGHVNSQTNLALSQLSGVAGNKSVSLTGSQAAVVKLIAGLLLRVQLSRGNASVAQAVTDPEQAAIAEFIKQGLEKLRTLSATNTEYLIDTAINTVNLHAGTSISNLSGTAGSKSATLSANECGVVKLFAGELLNAAVQGRKTNQQLLDLALAGARQLKTRNFKRS